MNGKHKCKILKEIRQKIADENDIPYVTRECTHQGDCKGTCPRCEAELQALERELEKRRQCGKAVAVTAVAAGLSLSMAACRPQPDGLGEWIGAAWPLERVEVLEGDLALPEEAFTQAPTELLGQLVSDQELENRSGGEIMLEGELEAPPDGGASFSELEGDLALIDDAEATAGEPAPVDDAEATAEQGVSIEAAAP